MTYVGWCLLIVLVVVLAIDWLLVTAASRFERHADYDDLDEADGTHEVRFDDEEDSK